MRAKSLERTYRVACVVYVDEETAQLARDRVKWCLENGLRDHMNGAPSFFVTPESDAPVKPV